MDDSLPRALIRFKQGIGRLVRSKTDTGRLVILDPRIRTKPYGKAFMALLPRGVQRIDDEF
jgi:ATP-dependent DNA helicase DinG